jgi:hypothetical protein
MKKTISIIALSVIIFKIYSQDNAVSLFYENHFDQDFQSQRILAVFDEGSSLYLKGQRDAKSYYKDYNPFAGTFFSSMLFPPAGLVTTLIISSKEPKEYNLGIPESKKKFMVDNDDYFNGYMAAAKKRKKLLSWAGFVTGTAFFASALAMTGYIDLQN